MLKCVSSFLIHFLDVCLNVHPLPSEIENERRRKSNSWFAANDSYETSASSQAYHSINSMDSTDTVSPAVLLEDAADWDAITDDDTGQVYYFNASTGASSWEWPPATDETEENTNSLEIDSEEVEMGQVEMEVEQEVEPQKIKKHMRSQSQPVTTSEWAIHTDPESGLDYWFNAVTEETQWV